MQKLEQPQNTTLSQLVKNTEDTHLKKSQKKMFSNLILVFAFFFLTVNGNAQEKCYEIIYNHRKIIHFSKDSTFAVAESDVNHEFNLKFSNLKLSFKNNQLFVNNNKVYCFTNVEFYEKFIHFTKNKKDYIYIYPQYENYYTLHLLHYLLMNLLQL